MSQVNSYDRESYTTNGVAKSFSFGWNVNSKDDVKIQFVNAKGEMVDSAKFIDANDDEYITSTYNFTVELNRQGGQIVFVDTPAEDQYLIIYRQTPLVYENSFKTATAFPAAAIDAAYRKIWLAIQEISADSLYNTLRLTPDQRGTVLDAFSEGDNNSLIYYDSVGNKLTYTNFKVQDIQNALVLVEHIPSIAADASEALNRATAAITIANNAKSVAELARQDASNAIQIANTKQDQLVSGVNIKTINGNSLLGSGDLTVAASSEWGDITGDIDDQADLKNALDGKVDANATIVGATHTKITYDDKGLVTGGSDITLSDVTDVTASAAEVNVLDGITATTTELNYVDGVTSSIQTQLDGKQATISDLSSIRSGAELGATAVQPGDLATVATTGDYDDLLNKPTIPTVNDATLTIQKNGTNVATFTANSSSNATANITVPTDTNDLTNGAGYITGITSGDVTTALGYTPYSDANPNGYTSNVGTVTSVNSVSPDGSGNVSLTIPTVNDATITITQGGVTKGSFTLNQASGDTIALDAGGGSVAIDNSTITKNLSDELQAVATVNANTAAGATNPIYDWVGTLAEYTAQDIENNHPDWVCYITDDLTSAAYDAYSKSQTDALLSNKVSTGHEVIAFQTPTAGNNYTWYRKYADGWVEQGGCVPTVNDGVWTITLPVAMADAHYTSVITREYTNYSGTGTDIAYDAVWAKTSTNFKCWEKWTGSIALNWQVSGMAA